MATGGVTSRTDPVRLQALIANRTEPPVTCQVSVVTVDGAQIIAIEVPDSPRIVGTATGKYVRRAIGADGRPTCLPLRAHEMLAREIDRGAADFARLPAHGATWDETPSNSNAYAVSSPTPEIGLTGSWSPLPITS